MPAQIRQVDGRAKAPLNCGGRPPATTAWVSGAFRQGVDKLGRNVCTSAYAALIIAIAGPRTSAGAIVTPT